MGLGPHGSSLSERVALPPPVWSNPFAMQMEGIARAEARRERAIYLSQKNRTPRKPEAPVEALPRVKGDKSERVWRWVGESIESKGVTKDCCYSAGYIRKAGFKLPTLTKKEKAK